MELEKEDNCPMLEVNDAKLKKRVFVRSDRRQGEGDSDSGLLVSGGVERGCTCPRRAGWTLLAVTAKCPVLVAVVKSTMVETIENESAGVHRLHLM